MDYPDEAFVFENANGHVMEATWYGVNVLWGSGCIQVRYLNSGDSDGWAYPPEFLKPLTPSARDMHAEARRMR